MSVLGAAGIAAAGNILGGVLGNRANKKAQSANADFQREVLQNQLQWRKEDAKKAGIHPVAALGMQSATGSPIAVGGSPLGEGISNATSKIGEYVAQKDLQKLQLQEVQSRIALNNANADKARSQAARGQANANNSQDPEALLFAGAEIPRNPKWSDTQLMEDRYGDVAGALYGLGVGVADFNNFLNTRYPGRKQTQNARKGYRTGSRSTGNRFTRTYTGRTGGRNRRY